MTLACLLNVSEKEEIKILQVIMFEIREVCTDKPKLTYSMSGRASSSLRFFPLLHGGWSDFFLGGERVN